MCWNGVEVDMKPPTCTKEDSFHMEEELFVTDKTDRIAKILDVKYQLANIKEIMTNLPHLTINQQKQLFDCLTKHTLLFDGTLGLWKGDP